MQRTALVSLPAFINHKKVQISKYRTLDCVEAGLIYETSTQSMKSWRNQAFYVKTKLTGRLSFNASTGAWKGQANWCFHRVFTTTFSRYCSWLVWRFGLLGLMYSGGGGLHCCWTCPWLLLLPDICAVSRPSPILIRQDLCSGPGAEAGAGVEVVVLAGHQFNLGPGTDSTDRALLIPLHSSLDSLKTEKKSN